MSTEIFVRLLEQGEVYVRAFFKKEPKGQLAPLFHGFARDGENFVAVAPWSSDAEKQIMLGEVRRMFAEKNVETYLVITEGWMSAKLSADYTAASDAGIVSGDDYADDRRPRMMPDRIEVVSITASDGDLQQMRLFEMVRRGGKVVELKRSAIGDDAPQLTMGAVAKLIEPNYNKGH